MTLLELQRTFGAFGRAGGPGRVASTVEWLHASYVDGAADGAAGRAGPDVRVPPADGPRPRHGVRTDRAGRVAMPVAPPGGLLLVTLEPARCTGRVFQGLVF
jgi:hypothetical protein